MKVFAVLTRLNYVSLVRSRTMLQQIRAKSNSIIIKIILFAIGASFVVWGIADVVRILTAIPPIAKMKKAQVGFQDFCETYKKYLGNLRRAEQFPKTRAEKKLIAEQILKDMVTLKVIEQEPKNRGILVPQKLVEGSLRSIQAFHKDGHFDLATFHAMTQRMGLRPQQLIENLSNEMAHQQFLQPLAMGFQAGPEYVDSLVDILFQKRHLKIVVVPDQVSDKEAPSDEALQKWMKEKSRKEKYTLPSQRSIELVVLVHDNLEKAIKLTEEDLKRAYQERRGEWTTPAQRTIKVLHFDGESDAFAARKAMAGATSEEQVQKAVPGVSLETIQEHEVPQEDLELVLALKEGEVYGPVLRGQKWTLYFVSKFTEEQCKPFEEVKEELELQLRREEVNRTLEATKEKIEDAFAGGQTFDEVAKVYPLKRWIVPNLTQEKGREQFEEAGVEASIVEVVFPQIWELSKGEESDFLNVPGVENAAGYSVMVKVTEIQKKKWMDFESNKEQILKDWQDEENNKKTFEYCLKLFESVESEDAWARVVKTHSLKEQKKTYSRLDSFGKEHDLFKLFNRNILEQMLLQKVHTVKYYQTLDGHYAAVFVDKVTQDISAKLDKLEQNEHLHKMFKNGYGEESGPMVAQTVVAFSNVKTNKESLKKAMAVVSTDED